MQTVAEQYLDAPHKACPVCGADQARTPVIKVQANPEVWFGECDGCEAVLAERFPTPEYLAQIYSPDVYQPFLTRDDTLSRRAARSLLKSIRHQLPPVLRIVDYGGADGNLSRCIREELQTNGYDGEISIVVVDLYSRDMADGIEFQSIDDFAADDRRFNLILASAVIEHLPDMAEVVRRLLSKREQGALFYARTPYDIPIAQLGASQRLVWPRHLFDLGPRFWQRFPVTFGVEVEFVRSAPSIVQSTLKESFFGTVAAHLLKLPSRIEVALIQPLLGYKQLWWKWVGGWEVVLKLK